MSENRNVDGGLFVARLLLGVVFLVTAYWKVTELSELTTFLEGRGFPAPGLVAPIVAGIEGLGGLALVAGLRPRLVAILLAGYLLVATLLMHLDLDDSYQLMHLLKNVGIIGGLVGVFSARSSGLQLMPDRM